MKKVLTGSLISLVLSSGLLADGQWYVGGEYGIGSGDRTYDLTTNSTSIDGDSKFFTLKAGHITDSFDKIEFDFTKKDIENSNDSSDTDSEKEYKLNFVLSLLSISYKTTLIPYLEAALGYGDSNAHGGQFASHLGLGLMFNPTEHVELTAGYRYSTNLGSTDSGVDYTDQFGEFLVGAAYKF